jgi:hypothetical protein
MLRELSEPLRRRLELVCEPTPGRLKLLDLGCELGMQLPDRCEVSVQLLEPRDVAETDGPRHIVLGKHSKT